MRRNQPRAEPGRGSHLSLPWGQQVLSEEMVLWKPCEQEDHEGGPEGYRCQQAWQVALTRSVHFIPGSCREFACFLTALDGF